MYLEVWYSKLYIPLTEFISEFQHINHIETALSKRFF